MVLPDRVQAAVRITTDASHITGVDGETGNPGAEHLAGTLLPGFVDLQCNGAGGRSVDEATPEALDTVAKAVWQGGAVAFLPTLITAPFEQLLEQDNWFDELTEGAFCPGGQETVQYL